MGDRNGLTKLDRTNGFDDGHDYMRVKKSKLAQQNDQIRELLRCRNSTMRSELFKGISINVNGRTQPTADELKRLILLNGGDYHPYYRYQTTKFMIATNLSTARMKQLRPDDRIVKPEWITESIQAKCLLPYEDYQLFVDEPRGKDGSVLAIDQSSSSSFQDNKQLESNLSSYSKNYRKNKNRSEPSNETKSRDIREMFSKSVRRINDGSQGKPRESTSNIGTTSINNDTSSRPNIMSSLMIRGPKQQRFFNLRPLEKRYQASICGLTDLNDVIRHLNDWIYCKEGITEDDVACVTRYFYDLMSERDYHNKLYEILDAIHQKVLQGHDSCWMNLYNNLVKTIKSELNQQIEATQNLYQLLTVISEDFIEENKIETNASPDNEDKSVGEKAEKVKDDVFNEEEEEDVDYGDDDEVQFLKEEESKSSNSK